MLDPTGMKSSIRGAARPRCSELHPRSHPPSSPRRLEGDTCVAVLSMIVSLHHVHHAARLLFLDERVVNVLNNLCSSSGSSSATLPAVSSHVMKM